MKLTCCDCKGKIDLKNCDIYVRGGESTYRCLECVINKNLQEKYGNVKLQK